MQYHLAANHRSSFTGLTTVSWLLHFVVLGAICIAFSGLLVYTIQMLSSIMKNVIDNIMYIRQGMPHVQRAGFCTHVSKSASHTVIQSDILILNKGRFSHVSKSPFPLRPDLCLDRT